MKKIVMTVLMATALSALQARAQEKTEAPPATEQPKATWADRITLKGDFRFRFESVDEEDKDTRDRLRIRARAGAYAKVNDEIDAAIALATGGDDPTSTNQTLGDGFSTKDIGLDLGYLDWHPEVLPGSLILGKMKMPFETVNDLIWDSDLNPEGGALRLELPAGEVLSFLVNGGGFWVEERANDSETMLYGAQAAVKMKDESLQLTAGASYYLYDNIAGYTGIYDETKGYGNSVKKNTDEDGNTTSVTYLYDYELLELFAKAGFDIGLPMEVYGSLVQNQEVDENDTGYMIGFKLGKLKRPGSMDFGYNYRELEKDAVLGVFADSDAWGSGTDGSGHKLQFNYQIAKDTSAGVTYFITEKGMDSGVDYNRLQLDLNVKF